MATDKYIDIDGLRVHYTDSEGNGSPLIVMHGWGCNVNTVASISAVAQQAGARVLSIDLPGHGQTPEPPAVWGVDDYTRLVERFVDALRLANPSLLGHSFGGRIGILYASRRPVNKLILVDAAGIKPRHGLKYKLRVGWFKTCKHAAKALMPRAKAEALIERMRGRHGSADYAAASPRMRQVMSRVVNEDLRHVMPQIKSPTLLIWGVNDTATPLSDAKIMERLIPDAGLVAFEGCGHFSFLDNPRQFAAVLTSFLKS